jgi:hypothetical protein
MPQPRSRSCRSREPTLGARGSDRDPGDALQAQDAASGYGQALSDAGWEGRIDTNRDLADGIDPDLLPSEQFLE